MSSDKYFHYELGKVDSDSGQFKRIAGGAVALPFDSATVGLLQGAVKSNSSRKLVDVDTTDLRVFENRAAFDAKASELAFNASVVQMGGQKDLDLLVVVVPELSVAPSLTIWTESSPKKQKTEDISRQQNISNDKQIVWFEFLNADGQPFTGTQKVEISSAAVVGDLRDEVLKTYITLAKLDSSLLKVFEHKVVGEENKALELDFPLNGLGTTPRDPIWVLLPDQVHLAKKHKSNDLSKKLKALAEAQLFREPLAVEKDAEEAVGCYCSYIVSKDDMPMITSTQKGPRKRLFLRECYKEVFDLLMKDINAHLKYFCVSGTPGIGKSMFFLYILFRLLKDDTSSNNPTDTRWKPKYIIYQTGDFFCLYDLVKLEVFELDIHELALTDAGQNIFYVIDGRNSNPVPLQCINLFICSPRCEDYKDYKKQHAGKEWFLPIWSRDELMICREKCYSFFLQATLEERFLKYGGVARMGFFDSERCEFDAIHIPNEPDDMETALGDKEAINALSAVGHPSKMFGNTHTLLHIIVGERRVKRLSGEETVIPYQSLYIDFASKYVAEQLWTLKHEQMLKNLRELYGGSPDSISRYLFEMYGHQRFSTTSLKLKCRNLETNALSELELQATEKKATIEKNGLKTLVLDKSTYYQPRDDDNFPAIDSLSQQGMFQFTVASVHPIRGVRVLTDLCACYKSERPKLYFVVPPHNYASFGKQRVLQTKGNSVPKKIPGFDQYVVELPV